MRRDLRWQLTSSYAVVLLLIVVVFFTGTFVIARRGLFAQVQESMTKTLATIAAQADEIEDLEETEQHGARLFAVEHPGQPPYLSVEWQRAGLKLADIPSGGATRWLAHDGRVLLVERLDMTGPDRTYRVAVAHEVDSLDWTLDSLRWTMLLGLPTAVLLAALAGYYLAGKALRPVAEMTAKAAQITASRLGERLPETGLQDELGQLATVFNQALARIEQAFAQLQRFTADASHELRTPLTAIRSVGEVALQGTLKDPAAREVVGSMLEEVEHLHRLVDGLLFLTRSDCPQETLVLQSINVGELVLGVERLLHILAEEKHQQVSIDIQSHDTLQANSDMVRQALVNLLDNAIRYTPEGGTIRLLVEGTSIEVGDSGPGIPEPHRSHIFDRFYRVDPSRARSSGGAGLGLAIAKSAVERNGGTLTVSCPDSGGSYFRISFPRPTGNGA